MKPALVKQVIDSINALLVDEVHSADVGHYRRVVKLAAYAERIAQMNSKRVAAVTDPHGHPLIGRLMDGAGNAIDQDDLDAEVMADAGLPNEAIDRNQLFPFGGRLGGGFGFGEDGAELLRESVMASRELAKPKPRTRAQIADDIDSLLALSTKLTALPEDDPARAGISAVTDGIADSIKQLQDLSKKSPQKDPRHVLASGSQVADPVVLRRHPSHLDVAEDVHLAGGEVDAARATGASGARAQGAE